MRRKEKKSVNIVISGRDFEVWVDEMLKGVFNGEVVWRFEKVDSLKNLDILVTVDEYVESPCELDEGWEDEW